MLSIFTLANVLDLICNSAPAVGEAVPIPTFPLLSTTKLVPDDEPIANSVWFNGVSIDNIAQGVDVPIPRNPALVNVDVAVPPKYAVYADS